MSMYIAFSLLTVLAVVAKVIIIWKGGIKASVRIFEELILALQDAPVNTFYDITPSGRILNRLSKD